MFGADDEALDPRCLKVPNSVGGSSGHSSKSARSGAPPVISVAVRRRPVFFSAKVAHPSGFGESVSLTLVRHS